MARFFIGFGLIGLLAACEATPVFDPANYYTQARYYDEPLPHEQRFWSFGRKASAR